MRSTGTKVEQIVELLNSGVRKYIDDHITYRVEEEEFDGYVILDTGKICPIFMNNTCSLNRLYLDNENKLHVSTWSTGNTIGTRGFTSLEDAVNKYNMQCSEYGDKIVDFKEF